MVTGDLRLSPTVPTGPGGVAGISDGSLGGLVIMDAAENWGVSEYGGSWFQMAMHEIGHSLGLGHTYDMPALTIMGDNTPAGAPAAEPVFPGDADIIHGQYLYPPDANDIDLYQFEVHGAGQLTAEIVAERMQPEQQPARCNADSLSRNHRSGRHRREVIARNDDYYSSDSWLNLWVEAGTYYVAVTSTGNTGFDPETDNTGFGGTSPKVNTFSICHSRADTTSTIVDTTTTPLDGDSDGSPGGQFDFWFQSGPTIFVDKMNDTTSGRGRRWFAGQSLRHDLRRAGCGRIAVGACRQPAAKRSPTAIRSSSAMARTAMLSSNSTQDGITLSGLGTDRFDAAQSPAELAAAIAAAINNVPNLNATATADGSIVRLAAGGYVDVRGSQAAAQLLESGPDSRQWRFGWTVDTIADNRPYLLGVDSADLPLADGARLTVPQGVTVMIDAGALLKLAEANV